MREVSGGVVEVQRIQLLVSCQRATALQYGPGLKSPADLGVEHDIRISWLSQPDLDLTRDGNSLRANGDESP